MMARCANDGGASPLKRKLEPRDVRRVEDWTLTAQRHNVSNNPRPLVPAIDWTEFDLPYYTVYVITTQDQWPTKIGISNAPLKRIAALQTSHWKRLVIWGGYWATTSKEARRVEWMSHGELMGQDRRLLGEWFDIKPEDALATVKLVADRKGIALSDEFPSDEIRDRMVVLADDRHERKAEPFPVRIDDRYGPTPEVKAATDRATDWANNKDFDMQPAHCRKELLVDKLRREEQEFRALMRVT
jgi:hypothetical protein